MRGSSPATARCRFQSQRALERVLGSGAEPGSLFRLLHGGHDLLGPASHRVQGGLPQPEQRRGLGGGGQVVRCPGEDAVHVAA
ncbi:hypothetical protein ACFFX0_22975 [Citricoccus parietis]|uniref:Uncharacterized protein n=1 Tax=Citricoccus parietis TaxID=592307 RepID=A0ABV5G4P4_9MICC